MAELREVSWAPGYFVSSDGEVYSSGKRGGSGGLRLLSAGTHGGGYATYGLVVSGRTRSAFGHRLVAEAFIANPNGHRVVRHLDGNPRNNAVGNLAWSTQRENIRDKWRHGTMATGDRNGLRVHPESVVRGESCHFAKLTESQALQIKTRLAMGHKGNALAREFGVAKTTISAIKKGKNWGHLRPPDIEGELRKQGWTP